MDAQQPPVNQHRGRLWEKVAEMHLSEKDLVESFDSEEDFVNYIGRKPLLPMEETKRTIDNETRPRSVDDIKKKAKDMDDDGKPKMSMDKLKAKAKAVDEEDDDSDD